LHVGQAGKIRSSLTDEDFDVSSPPPMSMRIDRRATDNNEFQVGINHSLQKFAFGVA
jgi:hypothetical protein